MHVIITLLNFDLSITDNFNKALEIMNRAVSSHIQPGVKENMAYFSQMERRQMGETPGLSTSRSPPRQTTGPEPSVCLVYKSFITDCQDYFLCIWSPANIINCLFLYISLSSFDLVLVFFSVHEKCHSGYQLSTNLQRYRRKSGKSQIAGAHTIYT